MIQSQRKEGVRWMLVYVCVPPHGRRPAAEGHLKAAELFIGNNAVPRRRDEGVHLQTSITAGSVSASSCGCNVFA